MDEDKEQSLETKINFLIAESEKARLERKRERILSKIDALYTVLIAISTFATGIAVAQYGSSFESGVWVILVEIVVAMLFSYWVGFKGMIGDSVENRLFAWSLLIAFLTVTVITTSASVLYFLGNRLDPNLTGTLFTIMTLIVFFAPYPLGYLASKKFTLWAQSRLGSLLGEDLAVWEKIKMKVLYRTLAIMLISAVVIVLGFGLRLLNPAILLITT